MRFYLTLSITSRQRLLPINYQYEISSWIYHRIADAHADFAADLHEQGLGLRGKRFKFTFGPLEVFPFRLHKNKGALELQGDRIGLRVSFALAAEHFIRGLFAHHRFNISNKYYQVDFEVSTIETLPPPVFKETMHYKTLSPVCVSKPSVNPGGHALYLHPHDPEFPPRLLDNLMQKFAAHQVFEHAGIAPEIQNYEPMQMQVLTAENPKSKLVTIKAYTSRETKVRGYMFDFELTAPVAVHDIAYAAGIGEKGSMGFGMVANISKDLNF